MAEAEPQQSRGGPSAGYLIAALGAIALCARGLLEPSGTDTANRAITDSAPFPVIAWCMGWPLVLARGLDQPLRRFAWALGAVLCVVHIAVAFHLGHGWSHTAAWEHTREVGGYGDGIFVNYAFALVWLLDAIWLCVAFDSYFARPRWLNWSIHGFLAFVVFNAAVVFGSWQMRGVFAVVLTASLALVWWSRAASANPGAGKTTDIDPK